MRRVSGKFSRVVGVFGGSLLTVASAVAAPIFDNTISIAEFGGFANTVASLQPGTYINSSAASLRTNDFQNLQSIYQTYGSGRSITRIGAFLISQGGNSSAVGPNGPGITFPAFRFVNGTDNPAQNITMTATNALLVFTANETATFNLSGDFNSSETRQAAILTYENPSDNSQYIADYIVTGNAFHDILYNDLTPIVYADGFTHLKSITVYSASDPGGTTITNPVPPNNYTLPPGHKFKLELLNTSSNQVQTWIFYTQPPNNTDPTLPEITFNAFFNGSGPNILEAQSSFTGFIRVGIVQSAPVPYSPSPGVPSEVADWSTSLGIQVIASTPGSMYLLWPWQFTSQATNKIAANFSNQIYLPYCPWLSVYLPLVSLNNYPMAFNYFSCLMNKQGPPFDGGTNPFLSYFYMLLGKAYASDIQNYQSSLRPYPQYSISSTAATIEAAYDAHRDVIPTMTEAFYSANEYGWTYTTLIRNSSAQTEPLVIFPAYKTLNSSFTPLSGFQVQDAAKGFLYAAETQGNGITFQESPLPSFMNSSFFPSDIWNKISASEQANLMKYWNMVLQNQLNPGNITAISTSPDGYGNGKFLFQAAWSAVYGASMLQSSGASLATAKAATMPTIDAVKSVVEDWLINIQTNIRSQNGGTLPNTFTSNFFVGDTTVQGICYSVRGMLGGSDGAVVGQDFGNAAYNDHHFAYGYWLGAIAAVLEWDNTFAIVGSTPPVTPWIAKTFTSSTGSGPYKMKSFVDLLWRDTRNPDPEDPDLPYNRHGNLWEGHSTANGLNLMPYSAGRNQESLAEDFNSWLSTFYYARGILKIYNNPNYAGALSASDVQGFDLLRDFAELNAKAAATSSNLYYNTPDWPYAATGFNFNVTAAQQYDNLVDSATFFTPGTPPCTCTSEQAINSPTRLDSFYEEFLHR